jgi:hypothetical protein
MNWVEYKKKKNYWVSVVMMPFNIYFVFLNNVSRMAFLACRIVL